MATKRQRANGAWEFCFQKKGVLPSRVYFTFDTEAEGDAYTQIAEEALARGVVPPEMGEARLDSLQHLFNAYELSGASTKSDAEMFAIVGASIGTTRLIDVNYDWVERWALGLAKNLSPSSIKKRVEFLGRVLAWAMRKDKITLLHNPVRQLPKGYATKNVPKERLWAGERDRRLEKRAVMLNGIEYQTEEGAIRSVLTDKKEALLFDMALETAMRLREMFTLEVGQIDLGARTIFLDKSKNGHKRQVPISSVLFKLLGPELEGRRSREVFFPFWNGKEALNLVTNRMSHRFSTLA